MNQPLLLLVAALAVLLVYAVQRTVRRRAKLRRSLDTAPSPEPELAAARRFWESFQKHRPQPHAVDNLTWDDLDMDSVFTSVNCCRSGAGSLWLYTRLRLQRPADALPSGEDPVEFFTREDALCRKMKYRLALLGPHGGTGAEALLFDASSLQLPYARFAWLAAVLPFASFALWPLIGVGEGLTVTVLLLLANFMACIWLRSRPGSGFPVLCGFSSLLGCAQELEKLFSRESPDNAAELRSACRAFRPLRFPLSVLKWNDAAFQAGLFDPSCFFLLPVLSYVYVVRRFETRADDGLRLLRALGGLDVAAGTALLRGTLPCWCRPEYTQDAEVSFTDLCHPLLDDPVPNSASFVRGALFTGSNASGKSTFLKAVAVNCILARTLDTCFARSFRLRRGAVFTSIAVRDSILAGTSYFMAELLSLRRILRYAETGEFCYVFIDEILRGTNTVERVAAAQAALEYLAGKNCLVLAATHDLELAQLLAGHYDNYHFREEVRGGEVQFDYKLRPGPSTTRNALALMETMGFPEQLVEAARKAAQTQQSAMAHAE